MSEHEVSTTPLDPTASTSSSDAPSPQETQPPKSPIIYDADGGE